VFEDLSVEQEVRVRRRIAKWFNKRPEDFKTLKEYNDYLEEVEDITFNLINDVNVEETEARIQKFAEENQSIIAANEAKQQREEKVNAWRIEQEKSNRQHKREAYLQQLKEEHEALRAEERELISSLADSDQPASEIMARITLKRSSLRRRDVEPTAQRPPTYTPTFLMDTDIDHDGETSADFDPFASSYELYKLPELQPAYFDPFSQHISEDTAVRAGGYNVRRYYLQAIEAAFAGLFAES